MTMKTLVSIVLIASLAACGSKAKKATTPDTKGTQVQGAGSAMGGATYGGAMKPGGGGGTADPCAGQ